MVAPGSGLLAVRALRTPVRADAPRVAALVNAPSAVAAAEIEAVSVHIAVADVAENKPDQTSAARVLAASANSPVLASAALFERAVVARTMSSNERLAALHATSMAIRSTRSRSRYQRARRFFNANTVNVGEPSVDADARAAAELERRVDNVAPLINVDQRKLTMASMPERDG